MTEKLKVRVGSLLVAVAWVGLLGAASVAQKAFAAKGPEAPKSGQATGSFTVGGKTVKLSYAAAFVDQKDERKPVLLLITDQQLPATSWTSEFDLMGYRSDHLFSGVAFWLDKNREVFRTEYYEPGDRMSTSASGIFDLKIDSPAGKVLAGSASSSSGAALLSHPVKLEATFSATLK